MSYINVIHCSIVHQDLEAFGRRVNIISKELENSEVYNRECLIDDAWNKIDNFSKRLNILENEAQVGRIVFPHMSQMWGTGVLDLVQFLEGNYCNIIDISVMTLIIAYMFYF